MNSMQASFAGGVLHSTDYFSSRDHDEGRAWLVLSGRDWHVLLPRLLVGTPCAASQFGPGAAGPYRVAHARPVTDCQELDGWRWRLELGGWHLPLPRRQILSPRPPLPQPYTRSERTLTLYTGEVKASSGQSFFGSIQIGVQIHATCRLWLVRDTRRGEKPQDEQRRLFRFHDQRPGGL